MVLVEPARALWKHRVLAFRLAQREVSARWKGSILGPLWSVVTPLFFLAVYTFVFGVVFKGRWPAANDATPPFSLVLFTGLILFQCFSETANASAGVVRANSVFVKQLVFPLEILPFVSLLVALFQALISSLVLLVGYLLLKGIPPLSALWLPLVVLPLPILAMGIGWFLAAFGTYMKDTVQITTLLMASLMFLCPVFYSLDAVPAAFRALVSVNPLAIIVSDARAAIFYGAAPDPFPLILTLLAALIVFDLGFRFFSRAKEGFVDVI